MAKSRERGFTAIELMVSIVILSVVFAVVVQGIVTMQARNQGETNKVDLTQQTREFMDQIVNDLHQSGYPSIKMFDPADTTILPSTTNCELDLNVACGVVSMSQNSLVFEGDVDGTGVSIVTIQESAGPCPCTIQRGTVLKSVGGTPPYYTEVDNVMNTNIFTAYAFDGSQPFSLSSTPVTSGFGSVSAIGITLYVQSPQSDAQTHQHATVTMAASAKITNINSL